MSEINLKRNSQSGKHKWFGVRLGPTSKVFLFFLALIQVIEGGTLLLSIYSLIMILQIYGYLSEMVIRSILYIPVRLIILAISIYTLSICVKSRDMNSEIKEEKEEDFVNLRYFGFELTQTSGILIFFIVLIEIPFMISSFYSNIINIQYLIQSILSSGVDWNHIANGITSSYIISIQLFKIVIFIYSIKKFSQLRNEFISS
ncbi:MAG: hypothetical protein ACFE9S_04315 [Candidatus Hermodarchaeota archaeon]